MLAHGIANAAINEYCHLGENTTMEISNIFVWAIWELFEHMYLKYPTQEYLECQLQINATWGWLGMFSFLDYMHYCWKNCPIDCKANLLLYTRINIFI